MPSTDQSILTALRRFAASVTDKMKGLVAGQPEDQLRGPLDTLLSDVGQALGQEVVAVGESQLPGRLGRPDYAVLVNDLLAGHIELKEPGKGADPTRYKGHDRRQWQRFQSLPNIVYADGNEWGLYRDGKRVGSLVRLSGDIVGSGKSAVKLADAEALKPLLIDFLAWEPPSVKNAKALAELLAPLCRMLRQEVADALKDGNSPLVHLAGEWRQLLFPDADDDRFADAYAQTVTFALLLARSEGASTIDLHGPIQKLAADHALLSRALQEMTDPKVGAEISPSLRLLQRVVDRVPQDALAGDGKSDPWLYFYEDFLAAYDPKLRKDAGAYYTPVQVVRAQVRLISRLLADRLNQPMAFSEPNVITLDPAVGTGTYLLGVINHAMERVAEEQGEGAVPAHATQIGQNVFGFEIMAGPYAVAQLRVSRALLDRGATLPKDGPGVYLTDTLESPHVTTRQRVMGWAQREMAEQHRRAAHVKQTVPVLVCLGNPPYGRHERAKTTDPGDLARTGGWVRYSDPLPDEGKKRTRGKKVKRAVHRKERSPEAVLKDREKRSIFHGAFVQPALDAGHGGDVKNVYNLYAYFWRWALWKVFEHNTAAGPGVVSYISASSYLDGDAFVGMREHMRRLCDEIWIIDLGGEGRGTRRTESVFSIQTPVAIAVSVCYRKPQKDKPAKVHYASMVKGTREEKLAKLDAITDFKDLAWQRCPDGWHAPFRPVGKGNFFDWPLLIDLMPWQQSGVQMKRTWPIAPDPDTLERRWRALLAAERRAEMFRETRDRKIAASYPSLVPGQGRQKPVAELGDTAPAPDRKPYSYRSFDRQWLLADNRLGDFMRPQFWAVESDRQLYLTTLLNHPLGTGPALTACAHVPDLHHFRGSYGAREVFPLYRDSDAERPNVLPGLPDLLTRTYGSPVGPEDLIAYVYGLLAGPEYTQRFEGELETRELRVPLTREASLFEPAAELGRLLLWLHTYGERCAGKGRCKGRVPRGAARCTQAVSDRPEEYPDTFRYDPAARCLTVGAGSFQPVEPEVAEFDVSGLNVVRSWLGYRMRSGKGKKSSALDDIRPKRWTSRFTTELLELLWILEATLQIYPEQARLLDAVLEGPLFVAEELPAVPEHARKSPGRRGTALFDKHS